MWEASRRWFKSWTLRPKRPDLRFLVVWCIWVFPKIMGGPQIIHFNRVFHYKPSILGYPYFWKHPFGWCSFCNGSYHSKFHKKNLVSVGGLGECPRRSKPPGQKAANHPDIDMVAEVAPSIWKLVQGLPGSSLTSNHGTPTTSYNSASNILQATSMRQHVEHVRISFSVTWGLHRIAVWRSNSRAP